jgi:hypothetical protein
MAQLMKKMMKKTWKKNNKMIVEKWCNQNKILREVNNKMVNNSQINSKDKPNKKILDKD